MYATLLGGPRCQSIGIAHVKAKGPMAYPASSHSLISPMLDAAAVVATHPPMHDLSKHLTVPPGISIRACVHVFLVVL